MPDKYPDIEILLAKSFADETIPAEEERIREWLDADPDNRKYMEELRRIWANTPAIANAQETDFDTERALKNVKSRLSRTGSAPRGRLFGLRSWLSAAAAIALVAVAWYFFQPVTNNGSTYHASADKPLADTLEDGTRFWLNRNSGLSAVVQKRNRERHIRLTGEAFFEVQPDSSRPFLVEVAQLQIQVLGTAFNVDNRTDSSRVTVTVTKGIVRLTSDSQIEILKAGEAAVYTLQTGRIERLSAPEPNVLAYQSRQFAFDGTPLSKVVQQLESVYGQRIELRNPVLNDCRLNSRYSDMELYRILELIADSFSLTLSKEGETYVLDGRGCGEE